MIALSATVLACKLAGVHDLITQCRMYTMVYINFISGQTINLYM